MIGIKMKWWALAVLLALAIVTYASARAGEVGERTKATAGGRTGQQIIIVDPADSTRWLWKGTQGVPQFGDASRDRDFYLLWSNAINDTVSAPTQANILNSPFSAESTATLDVHALGRIGLFMRCIPAGGDTTNPIRFGVQVRAHPILSQDSTSTFPISSLIQVADVAGEPDSLGQFVGPQIMTGPGIGETVVSFNPKNYLPSAFRSNNGQGGQYVILQRRGENPWMPFMSVRIRMLGPLGGGKPRIILTVTGSPL